MKRLMFLFLVHLAFIAFGQKSAFRVYGTITDCPEGSPVAEVIMKLVGSDGNVVETKTDSSGNYVFSECFEVNTDYILTTRVTYDVGIGRGVSYGLCPDVYHGEHKGFVNSNAKHKFTYTDTTKSV